MTGYGQDSDRQRSLDAGFDHHLSKPADFGKVQDILATVSAVRPDADEIGRLAILA
jgi:CheY-like chemotaxis protein